MKMHYPPSPFNSAIRMCPPRRGNRRSFRRRSISPSSLPLAIKASLKSRRRKGSKNERRREKRRAKQAEIGGARRGIGGRGGTGYIRLSVNNRGRNERPPASLLVLAPAQGGAARRMRRIEFVRENSEVTWPRARARARGGGARHGE